MNVHRWSEMCDGEFYEVVLAEDYDAITVEMEKDKDLITRLRHEIDIQKKNWFALFDEAKKVPGLEEKIEALEKQLAESTAKVAELKDAVEFQANYAEKWRKERDQLQSRYDELSELQANQKLELIHAESRLAESEGAREGDAKALSEGLWRERTLQEKLAAAEAEIKERIEAYNIAHDQALMNGEWAQKLAAGLGDILEIVREAGVWGKDKCPHDTVLAEFEAWKKERGV